MEKVSKLKQEFPTLLDFQIYQAKEAEKRKRIKQSYKSKQVNNYGKGKI